MQLLEDCVEPLERKAIFFGLERDPAEHADRRDIIVRLLHQPHIVIPSFWWPLLGVVIAAVPDERRAWVDRVELGRNQVHCTGYFLIERASVSKLAVRKEIDCPALIRGCDRVLPLAPL